ncbi:MAG: carboxypeptidase-like regulatory domain-containing protein [Bacteroidota bacterium]
MRFEINSSFKFFGIVLAIFLYAMEPILAQEAYTEYQGKVLDKETKDPLVFVSLAIQNSNISTVTNTEGAFTLKVPNANKDAVLVVSLLGYEQSEVRLNDLAGVKGRILLTPRVTELNEVNVLAFTNAETLVRKVFQDKIVNSTDQLLLMTAFYRETIKKRNRNVSLTEAVVNVYKQPYNTKSKDVISLHKARKSTDYKRLDTVALKLQGGPFSTLYLDVMKYPEYIFNDETIDFYDFTFEAPTTVNDKPVYVVRFKQKEIVVGSGYLGKLYIDVESLALASATYALNILDSKEASELFVRKKPGNIRVDPLKAAYRVDYREKNGKWYYGYGSVQVSFKISRKRRLFNSVYTLSSEMAVTDWEINSSGFMAMSEDRLKPTVIIADAVSGFSDPNFWGPYNVIEPEKSIESAIDKIKRKIKRANR